MEIEAQYDYVVVGAGTAGCAVAARLVERFHPRVLLIEAGGSDRDNPNIARTDLPSTASLWADPAAVWGYQTEPQPALDSRTVPIPQGRVLGGGSSVNAMIHVRGNRRDFDGWHRAGNRGWSYRDVLPLFRRSEHYPAGDPEFRGTGGPLRVRDLAQPSEASAAFVAGASALGFAGPIDYNAGVQEDGAFFYQSTRSSGTHRCSAADAYLRPVLGDPNLTVLVGARANRLLTRGSDVVGVEYELDGRPHRVGVTTETIVTCGALASPTLLMRSGIGPAADLVGYGIEPVADLPGVGRNLQDHVLFGIGYESRRPLAAPELLAEAGLFTRLGTGEPDRSPDVQLFFGPVQFVPERYQTDGPGFTVAPVLAQPHSRGSVRLRSADPADLPVVDPGYLRVGRDLDVLVDAVRLSRELVHTGDFDGLRGRELAPGEGLDGPALRDYLRGAVSTVWHPVGTCRMGADDDAVVDDRLRVRGVGGLRVADASVMPTITCGNTNAATLMIAERAADLVGEALTGRLVTESTRKDEAL